MIRRQRSYSQIGKRNKNTKKRMNAPWIFTETLIEVAKRSKLKTTKLKSDEDEKQFKNQHSKVQTHETRQGKIHQQTMLTDPGKLHN